MTEPNHTEPAERPPLDTGLAPWRRHRALTAAGVVVVGLMVLGLAGVAAESAGWPFLVAPMQRALGTALERPVHLVGTDADGASGVRIQLFGGISVQARQIEVGAPEWSPGPPLLRADNSRLELRYTDLWRAWRGQPLRVKRVDAELLRLALRRGADGRANWDSQRLQRLPKEVTPLVLPVFEDLRVAQGHLAWDDALLDSQGEAQFSLLDGAQAATAGLQATAAAGLHVQAAGRYQRLPLKIKLDTTGVLPWVAQAGAGANQRGVPFVMHAQVGRAELQFDGRLRDAQQMDGLIGRFTLAGPSLAAVGDVIGVSLPTTAAFTSKGMLVRQGALWNVKVDQALIGGSRLTAALRYDTARSTPMLIGRLGGSRLLLADLGPAVGTAPAATTAAGAAAGKAAPQAAGTASGRVLPSREFDLPALRAMDANVLVDFAELDLGTPRLLPLKPLQTHLLLQSGVLELKHINARTADGRLGGSLSLDGRDNTAQWRGDLRWSDVRLERWLQLARAQGQPAWVTGRFEGRARFEGQGRSTAQILASLDGSLRGQLRDGSISHLLVEAAGIDLAQGLGVYLTGDDALPMSCALADWRIDKGVLRPRVMLLDTRDSVLRIDGSVSLADESLDLQAVVSPKDFSPLALRTPVRVRGSLSAPQVSLAPGPIGGKLLASGLLALVNPLAALLPLIDLGGGAGSDTDQNPPSSGCQALAARAAQAGKGPATPPATRP